MSQAIRSGVRRISDTDVPELRRRREKTPRGNYCPWSEDAVQGRLLFLPPYEDIVITNRKRHEGRCNLTSDLITMHRDNPDGFNHPVVVMSRASKEHIYCHLLTSFVGQTLPEKHKTPKDRQVYMPVVPSLPHPDSTADQPIMLLRFAWELGSGEKTKAGCVVVRQPFKVEWKDLELWKENDSSFVFGKRIHFTKKSMEALMQRTRDLHGDTSWDCDQFIQPPDWMNGRMPREVIDFKRHPRKVPQGLCPLSGLPLTQCPSVVEEVKSGHPIACSAKEHGRTCYTRAQLLGIRHWNRLDIAMAEKLHDSIRAFEMLPAPCGEVVISCRVLLKPITMIIEAVGWLLREIHSHVRPEDMLEKLAGGDTQSESPFFGPEKIAALTSALGHPYQMLEQVAVEHLLRVVCSCRTLSRVVPQAFEQACLVVQEVQAHRHSELSSGAAAAVNMLCPVVQRFRDLYSRMDERAGSMTHVKCSVIHQGTMEVIQVAFSDPAPIMTLFLGITEDQEDAADLQSRNLPPMGSFRHDAHRGTRAALPSCEDAKEPHLERPRQPCHNSALTTRRSSPGPPPQASSRPSPACSDPSIPQPRPFNRGQRRHEELERKTSWRREEPPRDHRDGSWRN
jgi:hypothetical protein